MDPNRLWLTITLYLRRCSYRDTMTTLTVSLLNIQACVRDILNPGYVTTRCQKLVVFLAVDVGRSDR